MADPDETKKPETSDIEDAEVIEDVAKDETPADVDADPSETDDLTQDTDSQDAQETQDDPVEDTAIAEQDMPEPAPRRSGGYMGLLIGGVIAGGIGFGAAQYADPQGWPFASAGEDPFAAEVDAKFAEQAKEIAALRSALEQTSSQNDNADALNELTADLAKLNAGLGDVQSQTAEITQAIAALDTRLDTVEKQPMVQSLSPEAIAAYERELENLQASVAAQRAEIESIANEAATREDNAEELARQSLIRAASSRLLTAMDTGAGFSDALAQLNEAGGVAIPDALSASATNGVITNGELSETFPDASRTALATARDAETGGGIGSFFRDQLGARSVAPREGDDPDAILSRAEAAVGDGRLGDALAELDTLPDIALSEMQDWIAKAQSRIDVTSAAQMLVQSLTDQ